MSVAGHRAKALPGIKKDRGIYPKEKKRIARQLRRRKDVSWGASCAERGKNTFSQVAQRGQGYDRMRRKKKNKRVGANARSRNEQQTLFSPVGEISLACCEKEKECAYHEGEWRGEGERETLCRPGEAKESRSGASLHLYPDLEEGNGNSFVPAEKKKE